MKFICVFDTKNPIEYSKNVQPNTKVLHISVLNYTSIIVSLHGKKKVLK